MPDGGIIVFVIHVEELGAFIIYDQSNYLMIVGKVAFGRGVWC